MRVGLDVDNVLYPFATVFTRYAEREFGLPKGWLNDEPQSWTWYEQWGISTERFLSVFTKGVKEGVIFTEGDPLPGSVHAANLLVRNGYDVVYVTDRTPPGVSGAAARAKTATWLADHGFPSYDQVVITSDKASVPTDIFLDDAPHNIEALKQAGHPHPVLWERSHNRDYDHSPVVSTWGDFFRYLEQVEHLEHLHEVEKMLAQEAERPLARCL